MTMTTRRAALLGAGAALLSFPLRQPARAALPPAEAETVAEVERYLDGLETIRADFEQLAPDGGYSTGTLYLQRPGKLRFDYDPPSEILLIATDWRLIFQDASVKQVNVIPLRETPLGFLLAEDVRLSGDIEVTTVARHDGEIALEIVRTDARDQGKLVLVLGERPLELRRWSVTDAQGLTTQVILNDLETNQPLDPGLFRWRDPQLFGWPSD
jgi:outer membrane lipoprotein-sorting protein